MQGLTGDSSDKSLDANTKNSHPPSGGVRVKVRVRARVRVMLIRVRVRVTARAGVWGVSSVRRMPGPLRVAEPTSLG